MAEKMERRRSSAGLGNTRNSTLGRISWQGSSTGTGGGGLSPGEESGVPGGSRGGRASQARHGKSGGKTSNGSGGGAVAHNDDKAAAYSLALARVRHETVQEGLRKKGHK